MDGTQQSAWIGVKEALARFGHHASNRPHAERERQCGELLLELLKLSDRMNVDLFRVSAELIGDRVRTVPRALNLAESGNTEG
ncbi:MAG: hypothetical protein U1F30_09020 [Steroidobacteraceae bacterium]